MLSKVKLNHKKINYKYLNEIKDGFDAQSLL